LQSTKQVRDAASGCKVPGFFNKTNGALSENRPSKNSCIFRFPALLCKLHDRRGGRFMKVLISGGSGLVGTALAESLRGEGHIVALLVRPDGEASAGNIRWDPASGFINTNAMESADAVVNLNGASIGGGRWNPARKKILRTSRIDVTRVLVDTFTRLKQKPRVFVSASASGNDFLADTCRDWEAEALRAQSSGIRTVITRFGVILSAKGGALTQMLPPFKLGLGGRLASGEQWMSWIALDDVVGLLKAAISDEKASGPVNLVAPTPVRATSSSDFPGSCIRAAFATR
jgi:uncharacterized protein (TIGR01777 family)